MNNNWIKEIDYLKYLDKDLKILCEIVGIDKFLEIIEIFGKTTIYFTNRPIVEMKKEYIRQKFGMIGNKELAREIGVSERLVHKIGSEKYNSDSTSKDEVYNLFY